MVKDSNEFVRKIYSSTPDTSMLLNSVGSNACLNSKHLSPLVDQVLLDDDDESDEQLRSSGEEEEEEDDEHEVSICLDDVSPKNNVH